MARRVIVGAVVMVVVLLLVWFGFSSTQPPDFHQYRTTANQAAEAAHDAVRTTALTIGALLEHRVTGPYASVVVDDAVTSVTGATQQLAQLPPPDAATAAMRAELTPLLGDAARELGDVSHALADGAPDKIRSSAANLQSLGDRLDQYLGKHA
jgi:hypothetical protein